MCELGEGAKGDWSSGFVADPEMSDLGEASRENIDSTLSELVLSAKDIDEEHLHLGQ